MDNIQFFLALALIISAFSFLSLAPWVPTRWDDLERIWNMIWLKKDDTFLEVWCGNARVCLYIAQRFPAAKIVGIELSPLMYIIAYIRVKLSRVKNIEIRYWNALKYDWSYYSVIYVFWLPETVTKKIFPKLKAQFRKDGRFFSYCFKMTNTYFHEIKHKQKGKYAIYEYYHKK